MLLPIYYLVITTFKTPAEAAASPLGLPEHFTLENYIKALDAMAYGRALCNNLCRGAVACFFVDGRLCDCTEPPQSISENVFGIHGGADRPFPNRHHSIVQDYFGAASDEHASGRNCD